MPRLTDHQIDDLCDKTHAHRLGNIAALDAMVANLIQKLDDNGELDNTYVIYTSDNGFHIGNHRLRKYEPRPCVRLSRLLICLPTSVPGKRCPYEEDVNIPLLIRGPGVEKGVNSSVTNSHTDMAPTILQMLGMPLDAKYQFDGAPVAYAWEDLKSSNKSELVNVEFWSSKEHAPIGVKASDYYNNTYKGELPCIHPIWHIDGDGGMLDVCEMSTDVSQQHSA